MKLSNYFTVRKHTTLMANIVGISAALLILSRYIKSPARDWAAGISLFGFAAGAFVYLLGSVAARKEQESKHKSGEWQDPDIINNRSFEPISVACLFKITGVAGLVAIALFATSSESISKSFASKPLDSTVPIQTYPSIDLADTLRAFHSLKSAVIVDARSSALYDIGHIENAINIPYDKLESIDAGILAKMTQAREVIVYCNGQGCGTAEVEVRWLLRKGVANAMVYSGGWAEWSSCQLPCDPPTPRSL
jgi:rhodanese-related sulfurtransferase